MTDKQPSWTHRMQDALEHLGETDETEANLKTCTDRAKKQMDAQFKIIAAGSSGTVIEKEAKAYKHETYKTSEAAYFTALTQHGQLKNERSTDVITIDVWRSLNAARNKGQIV